MTRLSRRRFLTAILVHGGLLTTAAGQEQSKDSGKQDCCTVEVTMPGLSGTSAPAAPSDVPRHVEGNPKSKTRVIVYEDLQCPDCASFGSALDQIILPRFGNTVAFEIRDFPLPKHSWARTAAIAARYFESIDPRIASDFRRRLRKSITTVTVNGFHRTLNEYCREKGIELASVSSALSDPKYANAVDADFREGIEAGVLKTPTVIVGKLRFVENIDIDKLQEEIARSVTELGHPNASKK